MKITSTRYLCDGSGSGSYGRCSGSSVAQHEAQLVLFILYLFDYKKGYLSASHLHQMERLNSADYTNFRQRPARGGNKRPLLRSYIKTSIKRITPACEGVRHNSPIRLYGEEALKYTVICDYMRSKYYIVEVDKNIAVNYLRATCHGESDEMTAAMQTTSGKVRVRVYRSISLFNSIRSAISFVYKRARVPQPEDMSNELNMFISGMKQSVEAKKYLSLNK